MMEPLLGGTDWIHDYHCPEVGYVIAMADGFVWGKAAMLA
jgi:hypothetical protein